MKLVSTTLVLATFCCASAFGLHGARTSTVAKKSLAFVSGKKPAMVQAVDPQGQRLIGSVS